MYKRIALFFVFLCCGWGAGAQAAAAGRISLGDTIQTQAADTTRLTTPPSEKPVISYTMTPKKYKIAHIAVSGLPKGLYEDFTIIGLSGLSVGDVVSVPGEEITESVKRFWKHGLFSDVKILADKIEGDSIWLNIQLKQRPRVSEVHYNGIKKSEKEELANRVGFRAGLQITPNLVDRAKILIKKYYDEKGYKNVDVNIQQRDDLAHPGEVIVDINIDKNEKTKIAGVITREAIVITASIENIKQTAITKVATVRRSS
ncbi:MAG: hypothetical protein LBL81_02940, partial [Tannerella sp.]|nr:hypothetical protein [Tannerella sp.]